MPNRNYRDLVAWQKAMELVAAVYEFSTALPREEAFGLTSQMRRAAVAVPANIAEGQGRRTSGEFLNHLSIAHGSLRELETHVMLSERLHGIAPARAERVLRSTAEVGRLIQGLSNALAVQAGHVRR